MKNVINEDLNKFIKQEILSLHKKMISEMEEKQETPSYMKNVYEDYKKNLEEVVGKLSEACNLLESGVLKQESHMKNLPEVAERLDESKKSKQVLLDTLKDVKKAKIEAERKLYELK